MNKNIAIGLVICLVILVGHGQALEWSIETLDSAGSVGRSTSLAFDSAGNPHISYRNESSRMIKHAWKSAGVWNIENAAPTGASPSLTSLALDSSDNLHIAYYNDSANYDLRHAWKSDGVWSSESVTKRTASGNIDYYSLAINKSNGEPHISYWDSYVGDLKHAWRSAGIWNNETLDAQNAGMFTSLAFDSGGNPHISYYSWAYRSLKHAWKNAAGWNYETVDSPSGIDVGHYTSLAFDSGGAPHISYYDMTNKRLKHAWKETGLWNNETVDSVGDVSWYRGMYTSLAFDRNGNPHISYYDNSNQKLKHAWKIANIWSNETVDTGSGNMVGGYASLAFDSIGNPHISYHNETNYNLMYASAEMISNSIGYSATVLGGQNTFIQSSNGAFGTILAGQSGTISPSVVLNNTGTVNATVDAKFASSLGGIYGLISGTNVLPGNQFSMKKTGDPAGIPLAATDTDTRVTIAPYGRETMLDAKLNVPATQPAGTYIGTVVLTFANED